MFIFVSHGVHQAHLELTFVAIVVPVMYVFMYLLCLIALKSSKTFLYICIPIAFVVTTALVSKKFSSVGGQGTFMLLFSHIFSKLLQFFGVDDEGGEEGEILFENKHDKGRKCTSDSPITLYGNFELIRTCSGGNRI